MSKALEDIAHERTQQIARWSPQHDDGYVKGELPLAAAAYAYAASGPGRSHGRLWPWEAQFWKPGAPRRMLVKAAALIVAEIERLDRACPMCDGYGYKDYAWLKMEPCDHIRDAIGGISPCAEGEASDRPPPERSDPMEAIIAAALTAAGIRFTGEIDNPARLDFQLEDGIYIEVKRMHSPRIAEQMSRAPNVIAVQGEGAVRWLAARLAGAGAILADTAAREVAALEKHKDCSKNLSGSEWRCTTGHKGFCPTYRQTLEKPA